MARNRTIPGRTRQQGHRHLASVQQQAFALYAEGRLTEVLAVANAAMDISAQDPSLLNLMGVCHMQTGHPEQAISCWQKAIRIHPDYSEVHYNLGNLLRTLDRFEEAEAAYRQAVRIKPDYVKAHVNLALLLLDLHRFEAAEAACRHALRCGAEDAAVQSIWGTIQQELHRFAEAETAYRTAIRIHPDGAEAHANLGFLLMKQQRLTESEAAFRRAIQLRPDLAGAHFNLGVLLQKQGRTVEAEACYRAAFQAKPDWFPAIIHAELLLPIILSAGEEIEIWRAHYAHGLATLRTLCGPLKEISRIDPSSFHLAYHNRCNRSLMESLCQLFRAKAPALTFLAPHLSHWQSPSVSQRRIRIGFLSEFFFNHTIGKLYQGVIQHLDRSRFEVVLIHAPGARRDACREQLDRLADQTCTLPSGLTAQQNTVAGMQLDVLFFPDIGMSAETCFLAYARLAPVQVVSWGHPDTSGLDSLDYFVSSASIEPDNADAQYTERLIRLHRLPCHYPLPDRPTHPFSRLDLGLPESGTLYGCPQSLFKLHPDFDAVLAAIAEGDPGGHIVLIEGLFPSWTDTLKRRWASTAPILLDRVLFLPRLSSERFLGMLAHLDVLLDPLYFGSGNTLYEGVCAGTPIVTLPGAFMRGRIVAGAYQQMGLLAEAPVAHTLDAYIQLALAFGRDAERRQSFRNKLLSNMGALFTDGQAVQELAEFLEAAVAAAARGEKLPPGWTPGGGNAQPVAGGDLPGVSPLIPVLCPVCYHSVAAPFFDGGSQVLATLAWPASAAEAHGMTRYPLAFVQCPNCTHVWNRAFSYEAIPYRSNPNRMFNKGVIWQAHLRATREVLLARLPAAPTIVEIGCGDGHFMRSMAESCSGRGRFVGFDPNTSSKTGVGVEFYPRFFEPLTDMAAFAPDAVVIRHVLEHLTEPVKLVEQLAWGAAGLDKPVWLFAEMPCIDRVFETGRLVDFYYEHPAHFTTTSFRTLMERGGEVVNLAHGYNLEVVYALVRLNIPAAQRRRLDVTCVFEQHTRQSRATIRSQLDQLAAEGRRVAIWGGTGKSAAFMHQFGVDAERFPLVVDSDPDKLGTFVPGVGQEICAVAVLKERAVDVVIIPTQWRAKDIVAEMEREEIHPAQVLIEHGGHLVDFFATTHPYKT